MLYFVVFGQQDPFDVKNVKSWPAKLFCAQKNALFPGSKADLTNGTCFARPRVLEWSGGKGSKGRKDTQKVVSNLSLKVVSNLSLRGH